MVQVRARNSQEALSDRGEWFSLEWISTMRKVLDAEGWGRMQRLEAVFSRKGAISMADFLGCVCTAVSPSICMATASHSFCMSFPGSTIRVSVPNSTGFETG